MNKFIFIALFIFLFAVGCAAQQGTRTGTTPPTAEVRPGMAVVSTERLAELERHSGDRTRLIDEQVTEAERREAYAREVERRRTEIEAEARRTAHVEVPVAPPVAPTPPHQMPVSEGPSPIDRLIQATGDYDRHAPAPQPAPRSGFAPPGMVSETQAYSGGSAPWNLYGGQTGGQELIIRVNSSYAIALALDGQMVQPIAGGMPIAVPAYSGGGITQVPVIPATRSGGWRGTGTTREFRILADSVGRRQLSWTCYSVVSGRAGRPAGQGTRTITVRPGTSVLITDTMCR